MLNTDVQNRIMSQDKLFIAYDILIFLHMLDLIYNVQKKYILNLNDKEEYIELSYIENKYTLDEKQDLLYTGSFMGLHTASTVFTKNVTLGEIPSQSNLNILVSEQAAMRIFPTLGFYDTMVLTYSPYMIYKIKKNKLNLSELKLDLDKFITVLAMFRRSAELDEFLNSGEKGGWMDTLSCKFMSTLLYLFCREYELKNDFMKPANVMTYDTDNLCYDVAVLNLMDKVNNIIGEDNSDGI